MLKHMFIVTFFSVALAASPLVRAIDLVGDTACPWGAVDCLPCVSDVETNFDNLSDNNGNHTEHTKITMEANDDGGEVMCAATTTGDCELEQFDGHIQGIGRLPNVGDNNWFVFSRSVDDGPGAFFAGQLTDISSRGGHLDSASLEDDAARQITEYYTMDQLSPDPTTLNHYGGLQVMGQYVIIATECYNTDFWGGEQDCDWTGTGEDERMAYIYDFSDPENVSVVSTLNIQAYGRGKLAALTQLAAGNYLMAIGDSDANLHLFTSDTDHLSTATIWTFYGTATLAGLNDYQNMNLVTECSDGSLYLVGTYREDSLDAADLLKLHSDASLSRIDTLTTSCEWCNFSGSGNIYITPENNMILYASQLDDEDDLGGSGDIQFEEFQNALNACNGSDDSACDYDGDGLINSDEDSAGSSRYDADTDGDTLSDFDEVSTHRTSPVMADSDGDGLSDGEEINTHSTNPNDTDSDDDSLNDLEEIAAYGTNPNNSDSDSDGVADATEITYGYNPNDASDMAGDTDGDGLTNLQEISIYDTDPADADSDNDGLSDNLEIVYGMDPNDAGDNIAAVHAIIMYYLSDDDSETSETDTTTIDDDGDGYTETDGDCDDRDAALHPDQRDCGTLVIFRPFGRPVTRTVADGTDQDCDGVSDEDRCRRIDFFSRP